MLCFHRTNKLKSFGIIQNFAIQPTIGAHKLMVASMVNILHQVIIHQLQAKNSKGVAVYCFLLLECLMASVARFNC